MHYCKNDEQTRRFEHLVTDLHMHCYIHQNVLKLFAYTRTAHDSKMVEMEKPLLKKLCRDMDLYVTPSINDKLYLHYKARHIRSA